MKYKCLNCMKIFETKQEKLKHKKENPGGSCVNNKQLKGGLKMVKPKYKDEFDEDADEEEVESDEEEVEVETDEDVGTAYKKELAKKKQQQQKKPEVEEEIEAEEKEEKPEAEEPKNPLTKQEIFDMIQGHLARANQLLPYLQ